MYLFFRQLIEGQKTRHTSRNDGLQKSAPSMQPKVMKLIWEIAALICSLPPAVETRRTWQYSTRECVQTTVVSLTVASRKGCQCVTVNAAWRA